MTKKKEKNGRKTTSEKSEFREFKKFFGKGLRWMHMFQIRLRKLFNQIIDNICFHFPFIFFSSLFFALHIPSYWTSDLVV